MRKYNRLKDRYYEAFINDEDQEVFLEVPKDFPDWAPKEAYQAYIDARCDGHEEWWNALAFESEYYGFFDSMEEFVETQLLDENIDNDTYKDMYNSLYQDPFFECVDLYTFGRDIYFRYESELDTFFQEEDEYKYNASEFIGDYDEIIDPLEQFSEREKAILQGIVNNMEDDGDYEGAAVGYIQAVSELDEIPFRDVILNLENSSKYIDFKEGINYFFGDDGDFVYKDGYVFYVG